MRSVLAAMTVGALALSGCAAPVPPEQAYPTATTIAECRAAEAADRRRSEAATASTFLFGGFLTGAVQADASERALVAKLNGCIARVSGSTSGGLAVMGTVERRPVGTGYCPPGAPVMFGGTQICPKGR